MHFEPSMVRFIGHRKELIKDSVPTIFCDCGIEAPSKSALVTREHSYCHQQDTGKGPLCEIQNMRPLGELQNIRPLESQNSAVTIPDSARKRGNVGDQENPPARRRKKCLTHLAECSLCRPPLKHSPPPPSPLPKTPPCEEVLQLIEENVRLKKQVTSLMERAELVNKIISTDQLVALKLGSHRGVKWTTNSLIEGLSLKFSCGSTGYEEVRKRLPLPSARTLRRCLQNIDFEPGMLDVTFKFLENELPKMRMMDRDCVLVFDEMSIQPRVDLDCSSGCYIGHVTMPHGPRSECACKAMVFMINGLARRYKEVVAYHFCGSSGNTKGAAETLVEVLRRCEYVGLNVVGISCDMGNRGILKELGFRFESENMVFKVKNPVNPSKDLYVFPDFVHVFKSTKEMLMNINEFNLPDDIVTRYNLPSKVVQMNLIDWLDKVQADSVLKYAPKLKDKDVHASHFKKMKVSTATNVISPQVGGALMHLGKQKEDPKMITTGWFVKKFARWFKIVTSRNEGFALSLNSKESYDEAIEVIKLISDIFDRCSFGSKRQVTQTHVVMACKALLEIQSVLLRKGYRYVCCGNFTQDCIENLFSCIRILRPKPSALDFKFRLKQFVFGKVAVKVSNSSYSFEETPTLISLLCTAKVEKTSSPEESSMVFPELECCVDIQDSDKDVLYRMCGYLLLKMKKKLKCASCYESLLYQGDVPHRHGGLVAETDIKLGAQVRIADCLFELFVAAERMLVSVLPLLPDMSLCDKDALTKHIASRVQKFELPTCHDVSNRLVGRYLAMRFAQLSKYLSRSSSVVSVPFSSWSMGMRELGSRFNPRR